MTQTITVTVKLFAAYRDMLGRKEQSVTINPGETVASLYDRLIAERASEALRRATLFAVNESYVPRDMVLKDGDRVAFIPPVSGG